jgi:hypothetical protein
MQVGESTLKTLDLSIFRSFDLSISRSLDLPKPPRQPLDLHQVAALGVRASPGQPAHIRCAEVREQLVSCPVGSGAGGGANP